jgi:hypothetical protein
MNLHGGNSELLRHVEMDAESRVDGSEDTDGPHGKGLQVRSFRFEVPKGSGFEFRKVVRNLKSGT